MPAVQPYGTRGGPEGHGVAQRDKGWHRGTTGGTEGHGVAQRDMGWPRGTRGGPEGQGVAQRDTGWPRKQLNTNLKFCGKFWG